MLGLRTWQFVLVWVAMTILSTLGALLVCALIWGVDLGAILGGVCGAGLGASVVAFAARDRMRIRAETASAAFSKHGRRRDQTW